MQTFEDSDESSERQNIMRRTGTTSTNYTDSSHPENMKQTISVTNTLIDEIRESKYEENDLTALICKAISS